VEGKLPLAGVRVVDLTRVLTGPYCTMMLADMGAEVIKIEQPGKGDDTRYWGPPFTAGEANYYLSINRNKRSIAIDLKSEAGKAIVWKMIETADVLVENFSPGTIERLGFSYDAVRARRPEIVYCSISGFGQTGPGRNWTAYDLILQAMGGIMSLTGQPDGPPTRVGIPIADMTAGMFAAYAIVAALYRKANGGGGEYIDTSLLGSMVSMLIYYTVNYHMQGIVGKRVGNRHQTICPYDVYPTADGYICLAIGNDSLWRRLCTVLGWDELAVDPNYATNADRIARYDDVTARVTEYFRTETSADLLARFGAAGIPAGPIPTIDEVFANPQVQHERLARTVQHPTIGTLTVPGMPYHLQQADLDVTLPPPLLGEHTDVILHEFGYDDAAVAALRAAGAVG
jgi:crotonobetainyl-CoA:carnitine CoA-transferase CaiB-like acyl-CoA transferase